MTARRFAAAVLAGVILWVLVIAGVLALAGGLSQEKVEEDDPAWNCATMGNRQCGDSRAA